MEKDLLKQQHDCLQEELLDLEDDNERLAKESKKTQRSLEKAKQQNAAMEEEIESGEAQVSLFGYET